jgi:hypothetical protein
MLGRSNVAGLASSRSRGPRPEARGLLFVLALALCGCFSEPTKVEAPPVEALDPHRVVFRFAAIPAPRLRADDAAGKHRFEEAVGVASSVSAAGLDAVFFGGDLIANETVEAAAAELDAFASLAGILATKRYALLGERERGGALARDEVLRVLEARRLVPDRTGSYGDVPRPGVRVIVLDVGVNGAVAPAVRDFALKALKESKEPLVVVVADQPPLDTTLEDQMRADARVKLVVFRAAEADVVDRPGEALSISAPSLDSTRAPSIRVVEVDGRRCVARLVAVPAGTDASPPKEAQLRPDRPAK